MNISDLNLKKGVKCRKETNDVSQQFRNTLDVANADNIMKNTAC